MNIGFKIVRPRNFVDWGRMGFPNRGSKMCCFMPKFETVHGFSETGDPSVIYTVSNDGRYKRLFTYPFADPKIKNETLQTLNLLEDGVATKITVISPFSENPIKNIQKVTSEGYYSSTTIKKGKRLQFYSVIPKNRKFLTGIKGLVEKIAIAIGTKSNGCEIPILRRISGKIIENLRKLR
jgi:hypothetical protein